MSLDGPASGDDPPESTEEAQKKERARRRRDGSGLRSSRPPTHEVEAGVDALAIGEQRRRTSKLEDDTRQSGVASQTGRSGRLRKPRNEAEDPEDKNRAEPPSKGASFKKMFQRSKAPDP